MALPLDNTPRPGGADRRSRQWLLWGLGASALLHLSAVTIFKVVIYFPIQEVRYYELKFVETPVVADASPEEAAGERWERLPRLEPPRLSDTDYQLSLSGAAPESLYQKIYGAGEEQDDNPLARLEEGLRNFPTNFGRLTLEEDRLPFEQSPAAGEAFTPASGYTGTIAWPHRESPRALLFSPPLQSLWEVEQAKLERGLEFQLSVDAQGRVARVWHPGAEDEALAAVEAQLMLYRFESADEGPGLDDTATVVIREAAEDGQP